MASAAAAGVNSLAEMFPALRLSVVQDVLEQCGNDFQLSLERLLGMADSPRDSGLRPSPVPSPPRTRQAAYAMLFPAEKATSTPAITSTPPPPDNTALAHLPHLTTLVMTAPVGGREEQTSDEDICPWLVNLDTGQGGHPSPSHCPTQFASRGWWPSWPVASRSQAGVNVGATVPPCCMTAANGVTTAVPVPPPRSPPPPSQVALEAPLHPSDQWNEVESLLATCKYRTPPRQVPAAASGGRNNDNNGDGASSETPPATPVFALEGLWHPGVEGVHTTVGSPCSDDDQLVALVPHLAHCLPSPSPSGTSSPSHQPALSAQAGRTAASAPPAVHRLSGATATDFLSKRLMPKLEEAAAGDSAGVDGEQLAEEADVQPQGYHPAELVQAVDFHLHMFPNLKREVVGDVLERYSDAPHTALDQLTMLSSCVDDATLTTATASSSGPGSSSGHGSSSVPDQLSWEAGSAGDYSSSSSGDEAEPAGASWNKAVTEAELAGIEQGIFPPDLLLLANQQQQEQQAREEEQQRSASPIGEDSLPAEEKLALLKREFPSIGGEEVSGALTACDSSLFAAAELLSGFVSEDGRQAGLNGSALGAAAAAASVPAAAVAPPEPRAVYKQQQQAAARRSDGSLPQHARPKVQHLARRFPDVPTESLEVALQSCNYELPLARRTLREAGYTEAQVVPSPAPPRGLQDPPAGLLPQPLALPRAPVAAFVGGDSNEPNVLPPPPGLSLSEATYQRNQTIFKQERAQAERLHEVYKRCFELASKAYARGDKENALELRMRGEEYRAQWQEEQRKASKRISKRVNAGNVPVISVDLHGSFVAEALETVESGIRNLPESIPGGVVVRYITGKGLHSAGGAARIKPEVVRLLGERGVPFVEGPGWVEASLAPADSWPLVDTSLSWCMLACPASLLSS